MAAQEKEEKKLLKEVEEGREARQQLITQVQQIKISEDFKSCLLKGGRPSRDIGEKTLPGINCRAHSYNSHLLEG